MDLDGLNEEEIMKILDDAGIDGKESITPEKIKSAIVKAMMENDKKIEEESKIKAKIQGMYNK